MTQKEINELKVNFEKVSTQLEDAQSTLELIYQLGTHEGFFRYWFEQLALPENRDKSKAEIFDQVNDLWAKVNKKKRGKYASYRSFSITIHNIRKSA